MPLVLTLMSEKWHQICLPQQLTCDRACIIPNKAGSRQHVLRRLNDRNIELTVDRNCRSRTLDH